MANKLMSYFDFELRTTVVYTIAAIVMGYISFVINHTTYAAFASIFILLVVTAAMRYAWKIKEDVRWWLGNGAIVYIILWMVVWTVFYNTNLVG
jgi:hypothetical protein